MTENKLKIEEYKKIDKYGNIIITRISVAENKDVLVEEGIMNYIYLDGVDWHHKIEFTCEKLELLKNVKIVDVISSRLDREVQILSYILVNEKVNKNVYMQWSKI